MWSNERSANEGNTELHGMKVNHQWSKSLEAEKMLRQYEERYITQDVRSFSLLRPFSELGIVEMFSHHPEYFSIFSSCNTNWKLTAKHAETSSRWCGNCPKCAFAFVMLAAFLPSKTLIDIFGKNLFMDVALLPTFRELIGLEGCKPFECVGTPEETYGAFLLADERGEWEKTAAMEMFQREALELYPHSDAIVTNALTPSSDHCIPNDFLPLIAP